MILPFLIGAPGRAQTLGGAASTVFDVEPFGYELKAEGLRRNYLSRSQVPLIHPVRVSS